MARATSRDQTWTAFLDLWDELLEEGRTPGTVIVVEGENDVRSLRRLGVDGRILALHRGHRLPILAKDLGRSAVRVVLLFDWDAQGGRWTRQMRDLLTPGTVEVDLDLRRRLAGTTRGEVVHVEGLYGWARRLAETNGAPLEHFRPSLEAIPIPTPDGPGDDPTG